MNHPCTAAWGSVLLTLAAAAQPWRAAVLEFEDQTGMKPDAALGGAIDTRALAQKGVSALGRAMANRPAFVLIDRRDFIAQMERAAPAGTPQVSFLRAAQAVNADLVLRGSLQTFSVGKTAIRQGGHAVDMSTLTLTVAIEALDPLDGAIVASSAGTASRQVRQTENVQTILGESDVLAMLEQAIAGALPAVESAIAKRAEAERQRPVARLNIRTTADPALVEIDGLLVGTTPIEGLQVRHGDHTITIGRAGYRDIRKRMVIDRDLQIEAPMIRTELSAEEIKDVLDKARVHAIIGEPGLTILPLP